MTSYADNRPSDLFIEAHHAYQETTHRTVLHSLPDATSPAEYLNLTNAIVILILLSISATALGLWPEPTNRFLWESFVRVIPWRLISLMEHRLDLVSQSPRVETLGSGDDQAKSAALGRIFGPEGIPLLANLRQARNLSIPLLPRSHKPPGLGNWDNSCYQNSMLQGLSSLTFFREHVSRHLEYEPEKNKMPTHAALDTIMTKLNSPDNNGRTLWPPHALKSMNSWEQQDAQEYFSKVVGEVDKETSEWMKKRGGSSALPTKAEWKTRSSDTRLLTPSSISATTDPTNLNPLEGLLAQRVGCMQCGHCEGLSMVPFNCLTLTLGTSRLDYDIQDCLDEYTALEHIDGVECAKCTLLQTKSRIEYHRQEAANGIGGDPTVFQIFADARLGVIDQALTEEDFSENMLTKQCHITSKHRVASTKSKQVVIARPPQSLVFHVNRSKFDEVTGAQLKNRRPVRFQLTLDLSEWTLGTAREDSGAETWIMDPAKSMLAPPGGVVTGPSKVYELRSVVTHYGRHENGHYIAYKRHRSSRIASEGKVDVNEVSADDADLNAWYEFSDADVTEISEEELLCHEGAFMLFYEAISADPAQVPTIGPGSSAEILEPLEAPDMNYQNEVIYDPLKTSSSTENLLLTPPQTPQPNISAHYECSRQQTVSASAQTDSGTETTQSETLEKSSTTPTSDKSSLESSDLEHPKSLFNRPKNHLPGSSHGITMHAGKRTPSRSRVGKSSDSFPLKSPTFVPAI